MRARSLSVLFAFVAACEGEYPQFQTDAGSPPPRDAGPPLDVAPPPDDAPAGPSGIGQPCTDDASCATGLICLTAQLTSGLTTNGYCTLECGGGLGCPADATCAALSATSGIEMCLLACAGDEACRTADGYQCIDRGGALVCWTWRVPPGTNDGGACAEPDGGPFVDDSGRRFGASQQLAPPSGSILESGTRVAVRGSAVAASYTSATSSWGSGGKMAVSASQNGGATFGPGVFVTDTVTSRKSDPVIAFDATGGHLYLAWLGFDRTSGQTTNMRVFVARSDDGGQTWPAEQVVDASTTDSNVATLARPWIATGPGAEVYVVYALTSSGQSAIKLARSPDRGATWDAPLRVDDGTRAATPALPSVATNAAGDVFVAWLEVGGGQPNGDAANDVYVARWDAGSAWAFGANVKGNADADLLVSNVPQVVPALSGARVYLVYTAGSPGDMRWDVRLTWSDDRGDTFTAAAITLNDDGTCATHFLPAAAVAADGALHVTWYDNRFGSANGGLFYTRWDPTAGAAAPNQLVSDAPFAYATDNHALNRLGNYSGLAIDGTAIVATWADPRTDATSHIRVATGTLP
jgi:hypothetical protein